MSATGTPNCVIRSCVPEDAAALSLLGQATFLEAFAGTLRSADILLHCAHRHSPAVYRGWLEDARIHAWIAEVAQGGAPVGYLILMPPSAEDLPLADLDERDVEVRRIYLLHRFQGLGLGGGLMQAARARAAARGMRRLVLGVYAGNEAAIGFYRSQGFQPVGRRTFRVGQSDCEDLILALPLPPSPSPSL